MKKNKSSQSSINEEFLQAETGRHSPVSEPETDSEEDLKADSNAVSGSVPKACTNIYSENREELSLREPRLIPRPVTGTSSRRSPHPFK